MNNRELYKGAFNRVESSEYKTMEEIMTKKKRTFRTSRRLVTVLCCIAVLLIGTATVNAATGGAVGDYFSNLFGGDKGIAAVTLEQDGEQIKIEVSIEDSQVAIYDEENKLVKDITEDEAQDIDFEKDNQSCTYDGNKYRVLVVCGLNEESGECRNQVRLYDPADYEKASKSFDPNSVFAGEELTVFCPYITVE